MDKGESKGCNDDQYKKYEIKKSVDDRMVKEGEGIEIHWNMARADSRRPVIA